MSRRHPGAVLGLLGLLAALTAPATALAADFGTTGRFYIPAEWRASAVASGDGRWVVSVSDGAQGTYGVTDARLLDTRSDAAPVSLTTTSSGLLNGVIDDGVGISASGRYVAFSTRAPLVAGDTNLLRDVYRYDRTAGTWALVPATTNHRVGPVSADGRFVVVLKGPGSQSSFLSGELWRVEVATGARVRIDAAPGGGAPNSVARIEGASLSGDGRHVSFSSFASNLDPADTDFLPDVYLADLGAGSVSVITAGIDDLAATPMQSPEGGDFSEDRRLFVVRANDGGSWMHVLIDRQTGERLRLNSDGQGGADLSDDGRYIAFTRTSNRVVVGSQQTLVGAYRALVTTGPLAVTSGINVALNENGTEPWQGGSMPTVRILRMSDDGALLWRSSWGYQIPGANGGYFIDRPSAPPPPPPPPPGPDPRCEDFGECTVAILGDSYISGEGWGAPYMESVVRNGITIPDSDANNCHRSRFSWAYRAAMRLTTEDKIFHIACSGAQTSHLLSVYKNGERPQIGLLEELGGADIVLVSVGGNDLGGDEGLGRVIRDCHGSDCGGQEAKDLYVGRAGSVKDELTRTLQAVKVAGRKDDRDPLVIFSGLPNPANPPSSCGRTLVGGFSETECGWLVEELLPALTESQSQAAAEARVVFESRPADWLAGHGSFTGEGTAWFHGYRWLVRDATKQESFHPNRDGWNAWADAFIQAWIDGDRIKNQENPEPTSPFPSPADGGGILALSDSNGRIVSWESNVDVTIQGLPDGTDVIVANFSLPTVVARLQTSGDTPVRFTVPRGTSPGEHWLRAWTAGGRYLGAIPYWVDVDAACSAPLSGGPDIDGDDLTDACDSSPVDGPLADADGDGVANGEDNCPVTANASQEPADWPGAETGAACVAGGAAPPVLDGDLGDLDGDGVSDEADICPLVSDPAQVDADDNGVGDACQLSPVDVAAPVVTATPDRAANAYGWYRDPVTITWSPEDPAPSSGAPSVPAPLVADTEGEGVLYVSEPSCDPASRCAPGQVRLSLDRTAPTLDLEAPAEGASVPAGDYAVPTCTASDALSGLDGECEVAVTEVDRSASQTTFRAQASVSDRAGNTTERVVTYTVLADGAGPSITTSPDRAPNEAGWYREPVRFSFTCEDDSGVAVCPEPITLSSDGEAQQITVSARDGAGNQSELTVSGINIDAAAPQIVISGLRAAYAPDEMIDVTCRASDGLSGLAGSDCPQLSGRVVDLLRVGETTLIATATDRAGNRTQVPVTVRVTVTQQSLINLVRLYMPRGSLSDRALTEAMVVAIRARAYKAFVALVKTQCCTPARNKRLSAAEHDTLVAHATILERARR